MRCPACHALIGETDAACPVCHFSLAALESQIGPLSQIEAPVADLSRTLSAPELRRVAHEIHLLGQRYPQVKGIAIFADPPERLTDELYAFWLFNRGGLFSAVEKGGDNHGLLLLIAPASGTASVVLGYGLEALMPPAALQSCFAVTRAHLEKRRSTQAAEAFFREMQRQLEPYVPLWPQVFGLEEKAAWFDATTGELTLTCTEEAADTY